MVNIIFFLQQLFVSLKTEYNQHVTHFNSCFWRQSVQNILILKKEVYYTLTQLIHIHLHSI